MAEYEGMGAVIIDLSGPEPVIFEPQAGCGPEDGGGLPRGVRSIIHGERQGRATVDFIMAMPTRDDVVVLAYNLN